MATSFGAWTRVGSDRPAKLHRCYEVFGDDAVIRSDCIAEILARVGAADVLRLDATELSAAAVWDVLRAVPFGRAHRVVIVSAPERLSQTAPLRTWLSDRGRHSDTTLILVSARAERGRRRRNRLTGRWETELADWQRWIDDHAAAVAIECPTPSIETTGSTRVAAPSQAAVWLSRRLPMSQRQAAYLWRRAGGSTALARDVAEQLRLLGLTDATVLGYTDFTDKIDALITPQGADNVAEDLLFDRRAAVLATLAERDLDRSEWSRVIGLLTQRLEWLAPLHHALATKESLSTVSNNLGIHEKWILHYAHRDDPTHNIARHYTPKRVARCRRLLADLDTALNTGFGVPVGFGAVLVASW